MRVIHLPKIYHHTSRKTVTRPTDLKWNSNFGKWSDNIRQYQTSFCLPTRTAHIMPHLQIIMHLWGCSLKLYNPGIFQSSMARIRVSVHPVSGWAVSLGKLDWVPHLLIDPLDLSGPCCSRGGRGGLFIRGRQYSVCRGLESVIITTPLLVESRFGRFAAHFSYMWHPGSMGNDGKCKVRTLKVSLAGQRTPESSPCLVVVKVRRWDNSWDPWEFSGRLWMMTADAWF